MSFASLGTSFLDRKPRPTLKKVSNGILKASDKNIYVDPFRKKKSPIARTWCISCRLSMVHNGRDRNGNLRYYCPRCHVSCGNNHRNVKRAMAEKLIREGESLRFVAKSVGITVASVIKYRRELNIEVLCPCGQDSKHPGWCAYRFKRSKARQDTMRSMHDEQREKSEKTRNRER